MGGIVAVLFVWATLSGINSPSEYYVSPLAFGLGISSIVIATVSYVNKNERFRLTSAVAAYCLLLVSLSVLVGQTDGVSSPFLGLWLIAAIFVGAFGNVALGILFLIVTSYNIVSIANGRHPQEAILTVILASELPLIISYILWHGNSKTQKSKDRAYVDLANELNQVSNKSDVVIGAISDGVVAINNEGLIELINPAAQRIVGWGHQDALGLDYKSVLQLLGKDGHELDKKSDPVFDVLTTNQPVRRSDIQLQTNSGKKINIEIVVSPIGRLGSGAILVFRDVTKEQEEERVQAEFISTASHEMRTPVASIEGYLGLALNPATATIDDKAREYITKAHESAEHLGRLFQDLLDVTKADDGRLSNNPKVVNVVEFTSSIVEGLKPKADAKNLRIFFKALASGDTDTSGAPRNLSPVFYVDLDADHLREVLSNLVENAIKYTLEGEVVVDVQGDDSHVVVSIADSGIGIPVEDIPHLFQKFYRVDNSDTREIGGTGLGLYLCRRLIETMGGRIWVESEHKKGSTFFVELPRISHEEANRLIEASVSQPHQSSQDKIHANSLNESQGGSAVHHAPVLATPIILSHSAPMSAPQAPAATNEQTIDPLVGTPAAMADPSPVMHHNNMVLPPNLQNVQVNVQQATRPQPVVDPAGTQRGQTQPTLTVPERSQKA